MAFQAKWVLSAMLLLCGGNVSAQTKSDSLQRLLANSKDDTNRLVYSFRLGEHHWFVRNIHTAIPYLKNAVAYSERYQYYPYQVNACNLLANAYLRVLSYDSAFYYLDLAITKAQKRNDTLFLPAVYETFHHLFYELGNYEAALKWALMALDGYSNSNNPTLKRQQVWASISVGQVFRELRQPDKAEQYFNLSLTEGRKVGRKNYILHGMLNLASLYKDMGRIGEAKVLYDSTLILDKDHYNRESSMFAYEGLAQIAFQLKEYDQAKQMFDSASTIARQSDQEFYQDNLTRQIAQTFATTGAYDIAESYFAEAINISERSKDIRNLMSIYQDMSAMEKARGNFRSALSYHENASRLKDSLVTMGRIKFANSLEILHRTQQKETEIEALQHAQYATSITLRQRNTLLFVSGFLLFALIFIFVLYYRNSKHREVIASQQKEISDEKITVLETQNRLASLQHMIKGQEMERTRIAGELHDSVCSLLSITLFRLNSIKQGSDNREDLQSVIQLTTETLNEIRRISHNLAPEILLQLGLKDAIISFCNKLRLENYLDCKVQIFGLVNRLPLQVEANLYAIVQELLQNVIKHSKATQVIVQINLIGNRLTMTVEDNGHGLNGEENNNNGHLGIRTIKNRVWSMNGEFHLEFTPGVGTTASLDIPINGSDAVTS